MSRANKITLIIIAAAVVLTVAALVRPNSENPAVETDYVLFEGGIYKVEAPLKEEQITLAAEKINAVVSAHSEAASFTVAIVPDKNYYLPSNSGIETLDYAALESQLRSQVKDCNYVNLFDALDLDAYYLTDPHWRQDKLFPVVERLSAALDVTYAEEGEYADMHLMPFSGIYLKRSKYQVNTEELVYLMSDATESALVTSVENEDILQVYRPEALENSDSYDVFLGGAAAVQYIENPNAKTNRELVLFRDSFGSSLAPLFIDSYAKITLVDTRYIVSDLVDDYVNYQDADVLFLYSTLLLNNAAIMR